MGSSGDKNEKWTNLGAIFTVINNHETIQKPDAQFKRDFRKSFIDTEITKRKTPNEWAEKLELIGRNANQFWITKTLKIRTRSNA